MNTAAPASRRRRKEARPAELISAALDVFVERGFAAARLDEIAARAGVSKGTLYLYFENKQALFMAVVQEAILPRIAEGEARLDEAGEATEADPERLLREMLISWWEVVGSSRLGGIPKLVMAEAANFPEVAQFYYENVVLRGRALIVRVIELGIARRVFREGDPLVLCQLALAPLLFACMWRQSFAMCDIQGMSLDCYVSTHLDIFFSGLRREPGRDGPLPLA